MRELFSMPGLRISLRASLIVAATLMALAVLALNSNTASAHLRIAQDDGEDDGHAWSGLGWLSDWQFSNSYFTFFDDPHDGWWHLRVKESGYAIRNLDVTGAENLHVQFWAKARDLHSSMAFVEVSDDGSSYTTLGTWDSGDDDEVYRFYDFDLSGAGLSLDETLWIRFRVTGDDNDGDLFVDDIEAISMDVDPDEPPPPDPEYPITIDGEFDDWDGKAVVTDPAGDQDGSAIEDVVALYWANNSGSEVNYHMIERRTTDQEPFDGHNGYMKSQDYILYVDGNNDGDFHDSADRRVQVTYSPKNHSGEVRVRVYSATSHHKISDTNWHDWGETRDEGGLRFEFPVTWDDLGIQFGEAVRMYLVSYERSFNSPDVDDRLPDSGDIQWSPASILGPVVLAISVVFGVIVIWYFKGRRQWKSL